MTRRTRTLATNTLNPDEWPDIIRRIRSGDPSIGRYLAERERRFDNFFGQFKDVPSLTQEGGQTVTAYTGGWEFARFGTRVIAVFSAIWDNITPGIVTGSATTPIISVSLPQGFNRLATGQGTHVGVSWFANDNVLSYQTGGVIFDTDHMETWPTDDPYTTPPTSDLADFNGILLFCSYRIPDVLV